MPGENEAQTDVKPPFDSNAQAARRYGVVPFRKKLFSERSKHRTYFDSTDSVLESAHNPSEISEKNTGTEHPQYGSISRPFCAVPGSSNVSKNANKGFQAISHESEKCQSHLHENK